MDNIFQPNKNKMGKKKVRPPAEQETYIFCVDSPRLATVLLQRSNAYQFDARQSHQKGGDGAGGGPNERRPGGLGVKHGVQVAIEAGHIGHPQRQVQGGPTLWWDGGNNDGTEW